MNDAHTALNTTVTRVQLFAIVALCALMLLGWLTLRALEQLPAAPVVVTGGHGIETTWPSALGDNRLWSLSSGARGDRTWIDEHLATLQVAQEKMPPTRR